MLRILLLISLALTLSACGANNTYLYAPKHEGIFVVRGYDAVQVDSSTYRVIYYGGTITLELADRYSLYRAAELTLEKGFDYFIVLQNGLDDKWTNAWNTVRMFKGPPPDSDFASFDAREVVKDMAPFIQRAEDGANK